MHNLGAMMFLVRGLFYLSLAIALLFPSGCANKAVQVQTAEERLGDNYSKAGRAKEALAEYDKALAAGADKASVAYKKGVVHYSQKSWEQGLTMFEQAAELDPDLDMAHQGAGLCAFELGRLDDAAVHLEKTAALRPDHWVPYAFLTAIYFVQNKKDLAKQMQEKAFVLSANQRALADQKIKEAYEKARLAVRRGAEKSPKPAVAPEPGAKPALAAKPDAISKNEMSEIDDAFSRIAGPAPAKEELKSAKEANRTAPADSKIAKAAKAPKSVKTGGVNATAEKTASIKSEESGKKPEPKTVEKTALKPTPASTEKKAKSEPAPLAGAMAKPGPAPLAKAKVESPAVADEKEGGVQRVSPKKSGPRVYVVLESSWPDREKAEVRVKELEGLGVRARVARTDLAEKGVWFRVVIGAVKTKARAKEIKKELIERFGLDEKIVVLRTSLDD